MAKYSDFEKAVITEFARVATVVFNHVSEELAKVPALCGSYTVAQLCKNDDISRALERFDGWAECPAVDPDTWAVRITVGSSVYTCPVYGLFRVFAWMETATGCKSGARFDVVPAVAECVRVSFDVCKGSERLAPLAADKNEIREEMKYICIMPEKGEAWATNNKTLGRAHLGNVMTVGTMPEGVKGFAVRPEFWKKWAGHRVTLSMEEGGRVLAMTEDGQTCEAVAVGCGASVAFRYPNVHAVAFSTADCFRLTKAEAVALRKFAKRAGKTAKTKDERIKITFEAGRVVWRFQSDSLTAGTVSEVLTFTGEVKPNVLAVVIPGADCVGYLPSNCGAGLLSFVDGSGVVSGAISQTNDHDGAGVSLAKLDGAGVPSFLEAAPESVAVAPAEDAPDAVAVAPAEDAPDAVTAAPVEDVPEAVAVAPVEDAPEAVTAAPVEADSVPSIHDDVAPVEADSVPSIPDDVRKSIYYCVLERIDLQNTTDRMPTEYARTFSSRCKSRLMDSCELRKKGIKISEYKIYINGVEAGRIIHNYASRKINGTYKELKPEIKYLCDEVLEDVAPVETAPEAVTVAPVEADSVPSIPDDVAPVEAAPEAVTVAPVEADSVPSIPDDVAHVEDAPEAVTAAPVEADSVPSIPDDVAPVEAAPEAVAAALVEADSVPSIPDDVAPVETAPEAVTAAPVEADSVPSIPDDVAPVPAWIVSRAQRPRVRVRLSFLARYAFSRAVAVLVLFVLLFSGRTVGEAVAIADSVPEAVAGAPVEADSVPSIPDEVAPVEADSVPSIPDEVAPVETDSVPSIPDDVAPVEADGVPSIPDDVAPVEADSVPSIPDEVAPVETDSVPSIPDDVTECLDDAPGRVFRGCNISQSPAFPLL